MLLPLSNQDSIQSQKPKLNKRWIVLKIYKITFDSKLLITSKTRQLKKQTTKTNIMSQKCKQPFQVVKIFFKGHWKWFSSVLFFLNGGQFNTKKRMKPKGLQPTWMASSSTKNNTAVQAFGSCKALPEGSKIDVHFDSQGPDLLELNWPIKTFLFSRHSTHIYFT